MKRYSPPPPRRRVPAFVPVPLRARADGWTPLRQAEFLGHLAATGSVAQAARAVSMARETAYRLRARADAGSFAAAWDAALGRTAPVRRKVTPAERAATALTGTLRPVLRQGRYLATVRKTDVSALIALVARLDAAHRRLAKGHVRKSPGRVNAAAFANAAERPCPDPRAAPI